MQFGDWSSDVCSSDLSEAFHRQEIRKRAAARSPRRSPGASPRLHPPVTVGIIPPILNFACIVRLTTGGVERRTAQFRVPFKVPFSSAAASGAEPRASNSNLGRDTIKDAPKTSSAPKGAPMEAPIQSPDDDVEVLSCKSGCWSRCVLWSRTTTRHASLLSSFSCQSSGGENRPRRPILSENSG